MDKAKDQKTGQTVFATNLKTRDQNYFRYVCLSCGQPVILCASHSDDQKPHFRHKRGNVQSKECQLYLSNQEYEQREQLNEEISLFMRTYFTTDTQSFGIGFYVNDEIIEKYQEYSGNFVVRVKGASEDTVRHRLNKSAFHEGNNTFSLKGEGTALCITYPNNEKTEFEILGEDFNFFHQKSHNEIHGEYEKVQGDTLYLNTMYLCISKSDERLDALIRKFGVIVKKSKIRFSGNYGFAFSYVWIEFSISDEKIKNLIDKNIELKTDFEILWPPYRKSQNGLEVDQENLYIKSNIKIENLVNTDASKVKDIGENFYKVDFDDNAKLTFKLGNEKEFEVIRTFLEIKPVNLPRLVCAKYVKVSRDGEYYLRKGNGIYHLAPERKYIIGDGEEILKKEGILTKEIYKQHIQQRKTLEEKIIEALKYTTLKLENASINIEELNLSDSIKDILSKNNNYMAKAVVDILSQGEKDESKD